MNKIYTESRIKAILIRYSPGELRERVLGAEDGELVVVALGGGRGRRVPERRPAVQEEGGQQRYLRCPNLFVVNVGANQAVLLCGQTGFYTGNVMFRFAFLFRRNGEVPSQK